MSAWMDRLAKKSPASDELPDPTLIWWKAQLLERRTARARIARPIAAAQWISLAVALPAAALLCLSNWPAISALLAPAGIALWAAAGCALFGIGLTLRLLVRS